jgi:hypothetical protein
MFFDTSQNSLNMYELAPSDGRKLPVVLKWEQTNC